MNFQKWELFSGSPGSYKTSKFKQIPKIFSPMAKSVQWGSLPHAMDDCCARSPFIPLPVELSVPVVVIMGN